MPQVKLANIVNMPSRWWKQVGEELSAFIYENTVDKGLDYKDQKFKALSSKYAKLKASGKLRRGGKSSKANLFLSGDMMGSLRYISNTLKSVRFGWSMSESEKLVGNARRGRIVTDKTQAISPKVARRLQRFINQQTQKNIRKNDTVNRIKLGK